MPIDPNLFASVPFRNPTAFSDLAGTLWLWHLALAEHVKHTLAVTYAVLPIGTPGGPAWLHAVQKTYQNAARALGAPAPPDLESYDLRDAGDFRSWLFQISETSKQLRQISGLG